MTTTTASQARAPLPGTGGIVRATVAMLPSCGCGQALDAGCSRYCPRCGVVLRRQAAAASGGLPAAA